MIKQVQGSARISVRWLRRSRVLALVSGALTMMACAPNSAHENIAVSDSVAEVAEQTELCLLSAAQREAAAGEGISIDAELALNEERRAQGLMHREELAENAGMLFYYPRAEYRGFWMFQTLIPLDIAFLDDEGRILQIKTMEPCMSSVPHHCPGYRSNAQARAALELNAGAFAKFDIREGDYVFNASCEQSPWAEGW